MPLTLKEYTICFGSLTLLYLTNPAPLLSLKLPLLDIFQVKWENCDEPFTDEAAD